MGLFGKSKLVKHEDPKQTTNEAPKKASEKIIFDKVTGEDEHTFYYINQVKEGRPVILNFEGVDVAEANKVLAFLAGAIYVLGGRVVEINPTVYLFARSEEFMDGTLKEFVENLE